MYYKQILLENGVIEIVSFNSSLDNSTRAYTCSFHQAEARDHRYNYGKWYGSEQGFDVFRAHSSGRHEG